MMQRPRSEGRVVMSPPRPRTSATATRPQTEPRRLSQSMDGRVTGCGTSTSDEDEDEEEVGEKKDQEEAHERNTTTSGASSKGGPHRPLRNGAATRGKRFVVLQGPGRVDAKHPARATTPAEVFMTHLPDSPPRALLARAGSPAPTASMVSRLIPQPQPRASIFSFPAKDTSSTMTRSSPSMASVPDMDAKNKGNDDGEAGGEEAEEGEEEEKVVQGDADEKEQDQDQEDEVDGGAIIALVDDETQNPEVDELSVEEMSRTTMAAESPLSSRGPHAVDIILPPPIDNHCGEEEEEDHTYESSTDDDDDDDHDEQDEQEYKRLQEARVRLQADQLLRDEIRHELESFVGSLREKCDTNGEKLVQFPRNFQQIVSLMTAKDIEPVLIPVEEAATSKAAGADHHPTKTWAQILIQNGLAKQQAYGVLDESEDGVDPESTSLAAKIALKMARIRQLDLVLEEKLGKNLYASAAIPLPKAKQPILKKAAAAVSGKPTGTTSRSGVSSNNLPPKGETLSLNHIERNKQVVENGAKAVLTRDEEQRLKKLMRDRDDQPVVGVVNESNGGGPTMLPSASEFKLDASQNEEIERMLTARHGVFQSAVLMALDDVPEDEQEQDKDEELQSPQQQVPEGKRRQRARQQLHCGQETKNERLRKQRLRLIDEELQFLHTHEVVAILPDDEDERDDDDDASDGTRSERSFMTTTSMLSTCSTRSGVTRRQLNQFVAMEINKPECSAGQMATQHEIQTLLKSLSHVAITGTTPRLFATTTTV